MSKEINLKVELIAKIRKLVFGLVSWDQVSHICGRTSSEREERIVLVLHT